MRKTVLACVLALAAGGLAAEEEAGSVDLRDHGIANYRAYAEFKMAHYDSARRIWQALAEFGNADALFNLAILAEDGLGEPKDLKKAEALYVAAADAGGFKAQYRLGLLYSSGGPWPKDLAKARRYLSAAAAAGDADAKKRLAALDQPGRPADEFAQAEILESRGEAAAAVAIYARLADAGHVRARTRLAWCHEAGRGVPRDLSMAARLFMASAEAGDAEAQYAIGVMYRTGRGLEADPEKSQLWIKRAADNGHQAARAAVGR
jgi:TPR repeat protein